MVVSDENEQPKGGRTPSIVSEENWPGEYREKK
jgi:hypothetical protein